MNPKTADYGANCSQIHPLKKSRTHATITIGDVEYTMTLTTRATKEIASRYGGLENLGDRLMQSENFEQALEEIVWLITLLVNWKCQEMCSRETPKI